MSKGFWLAALVLVFAVAFSMAQTTNPSPGSSTNAPNGASTGSQLGGGSTPGTPVQGGGENAISSVELQSQIQNALSKEPTLAYDHLNVSVSDEQIELSGAVTTPREKLAAQRIVQSYAGNRRVKDQVKVSGRSHAAAQ